MMNVPWRLVLAVIVVANSNCVLSNEDIAKNIHHFEPHNLTETKHACGAITAQNILASASCMSIEAPIQITVDISDEGRVLNKTCKCVKR